MSAMRTNLVRLFHFVAIRTLANAGFDKKSFARLVLVRLLECRRFGLGIVITRCRLSVADYTVASLENYCS